MPFDTDNKHAELLESVELFSGLDRVTRAKLAAHMEAIVVDDGDVIAREGERGDAMFLVVRGNFKVLVLTDGGNLKEVGILSAGDVFGEMALLTSQPRSATVRADGQCEVLRLDRVHFLSLVNEEPAVALSIASTLSHRLDTAQTGRRAPRVTRTSKSDTRVAVMLDRRFWRTRLSGFGIAFVILLAGWLIPAPWGMPATGWHALMMLFATLPILATGALPDGVTALALALMWVVSNVVPPTTALSGFAIPSWVLVVSVYVIGSAVGTSGLLFRLALFLVTHTRGGFASQVLALGAAGLLLGPASPNATGRVAMIAPAVTELVDSLGHARRSRAAAGLAMATLSGFGQMTGAFLTSSTTAVLVFAVLPASARAGIDWLDWAAYGLVFNLVIFAGLMAAIIRMFNPSRDDTQIVRRAHSVLALQRALLGPPSHDERWAASVTCLMLLGFVTQPVHGLHPAWIAVVALTLLGAARVVTDETIRKINWSFALMFGILASMAAVFHATGLDHWITNVASSALAGMSGHSVMFLLAFTLVCVGANLVLRWQAAAPLLTIALSPIAIAANINPVIIGIIAVVVCNGFVLPYQSTVYLSLYHGTDGTLFTHAQARPLAFVFTALSFIAVIASVPYWYALGLMR